MSIIAWVIVITAISGVVGTGLGGVIGAIFKRYSSKIVSLLLSFAGGVMLAVVCFDLIPEAMRVDEDGSKIHVLYAILGIIIGFAVVFLNKRNCVPSFLLILIEPHITANGDFVRTAVPEVFGAARFKCLPLSAEKIHDARVMRALFFFIGESDKCCIH